MATFHLGSPRPATGGLSAEALDYIARVQAAGDTLTADEIRLADTFIQKGKADGWWALMYDVGLFLGRTLPGALVKLKSTVGTTGTLTSTAFVAADFSPTVGITAPAGNSTKFLDTGFAPATNGLAYNNLSLAVASVAEYAPASGYLLSNYNAAVSDVQVQLDPIVSGLAKNGGGNTFSSAYAPQVIVLSCSSSLVNVWTNGVLQNSGALTTCTVDGTIQLFHSRQFGTNYFGAGSCGGYAVGSTLTGAQAQSLNDALTAVLVGLGRLRWANKPSCVFFGDSITYGDITSANGNRWARAVAAALQLNELNAGAQTRYLRSTQGKVPGGYAQKSDVTRLGPQYVVLMLGTNDMNGDTVANGDPTIAADYQTKMEAMIAEWQAAGIRVIVASPPYSSGFNAAKLSLYVAKAALAASNKGVPFVDTYRAIADKATPGNYMANANHPNDAGHALIAQRVIEVFRGRFCREAGLDFPSIAAQSSTDLSATLLGARAGDAVTVTPPASLEAGLTVAAFVSAPDTVAVRVTNVTAAAIDPTSNTFLITLTRPQ